MPHIRVELNFLQYLHEKAQESRNKELQAFLMFVAGAVFFIGGLLETLSLTENPEWFIFIPYHATPIPGAILGLTLEISGLSLMVFGMLATLRWRLNRRVYMEELRKASSKKWEELTEKSSVELSTPPVQKPTVKSSFTMSKPPVQKPTVKSSFTMSKPPVQKPTVKIDALGEWWVYDNWTVRPYSARVHKGDCLYCNHGRGLDPDKTDEENFKWRGPYPTWEKAWEVAEQLERQETTFCKKCCRELDEAKAKDQLDLSLGEPQAVMKEVDSEN